MQERREEREALREMEEEKRLNEEREHAEQQKKRREEREAQRKREEEAQRRAQEQTAQQQPAQEVKKPQKARKKAADKTSEPEQSPRQTQPHETAQRASAFAGDGELYIERDDEFIRESIEARPEYGEDARTGESFTIEEAEEAFLYGMNAARRRRVKPQAKQAEEQDLTPPVAEIVPEMEVETPLEDADTDELFIHDEEEHQSAMQGEFEEEYPAEEPEETAEFDDLPTRVSVAETVREASGATPSSIPASGVRRATQPRPAVQEAQEEQTIVQLRGTRLDGTPIVMPKKDTHEMPEAAQEYVYPPIDLLERSGKTQDPNQRAKDEDGAKKLLSTLENFSVQAKLVGITHGPAITRYELQPGPGVKVSRISNLVDDIALNMAVDGVRIAPIPGKPYVGIEVPNDKIEMVSLRDILESREMTSKTSPTLVALGKGISGAPIAADLAAMPHVLIAGATGSGKSVCINTIINSIIFRSSPQEVRLILIDPKVVELSVYNGIPHLLIPVVTDPKKASAALSWAVVEMEHRYKRFETMGVRDIKGYNNAIGPDEEKMSKIIVIIDELADLMMVAPGEVEDSICRLAQLARAAGIHLVIATQRPSVNVITGVIKANIPSRIAFAVSSQIDSRTILDGSGAEKLLGKGDMLYAPQGTGKPTRVQGCFVSDDEVARIVSFVRGNHEAEYSEDVIEQLNAVEQEEKAASGEEPASAEPVDEMLAKAIELAVESGQVSISMLQRRLRVGYARAGRLVDEMTLRGIVGEADGPTKPRTVLISREEWRRMQENQE
ncbi:MAG: DNA translocase FtsK [Clostridia bacterium]|nr:DNA translocase FtsK [Clostridia bacterium]